MSETQKQIEYEVKQLRGVIDALRRRLDGLEMSLDEGQFQLVNSLGEVQGLGASVDTACARINTLHRFGGDAK